MPRLILITVGTSLLDKLKAGHRIGSGVTAYGNPLHDEMLAGKCDAVKEDTPLNAERWLSSSSGCELVKKIVTRLDSLRATDDRRAAPAEIASLRQMDAAAKNGDRAVFIYTDTPEGALCARVLQSYVAAAGVALSDPARDLHCVEGLSTDSIDAFTTQGIPNLARILCEQIQRARDEHLQPIVNATGGYKGMTPFTTLVGLWSGVPVHYLYESAETNIVLPPLPIQLDLAEYRRHRHLLNLLVHGNPEDERLRESLPESMRTLVERDSATSFRFTVFGQILEKLHGSIEKGQGGGGLLVGPSYLLDPDLRNELLNRVALVEKLLDVEYRIPQVVDHAKAHLGALLEFTDQICLPILLAQKSLPEAERRFTSAEIYVLLSWVWLHDIGHAGGGLLHYGYDGVVVEPDEIRKLHHLMSHQSLLDKPGSYGFPEGAEDRIDVVAQTCIYHPYAMPMQPTDPAFVTRMKAGATIQVKDPPREMNFSWKGQTLPIRVPFLASLGRLIDACDVQRGRAGHPYYQMWRQRTTELEQRMWRQRQEELRAVSRGTATMAENTVEKWITGELLFREIQRAHFEKHNQVTRVAWHSEGEYGPRGPFGFQIEIEQASLEERNAARTSDPLAQSIARDALAEASKALEKMREAVRKYLPGDDRWLSPFVSWEKEVEALGESWEAGGAPTVLNVSEEATYSRLILRAIAADIIKEYAKVRVILEPGGVLIRRIRLRWEDESCDDLLLVPD